MAMHERIHSFNRRLTSQFIAEGIGLKEVETDGYVEAICSLNTYTLLRTLRWAKEEIVNADGMKGILLVKKGAEVKKQGDELIVWEVLQPKKTFCKIVNNYSKNIIKEERVYSGELSINKMVEERKVTIGKNTVIHPGVILEEGVVIGDNCSIGGQGFGIDRSSEYNSRYIHIGGVYISRGCTISSNTCIDAGLIDFTYLEAGVAIDNNVQIGHNVVIRRKSIITAGAVLCGSCTIGEGSWIGPNSVVLQGVKVGTEATVGAGCVVRKNLKNKAVAFGNPMSVKDVKIENNI